MNTPFDFLLFVLQKIAAAIKNESRKNPTTDATTGTTIFLLRGAVANKFGLSPNLSGEETDNKEEFNTSFV